MKEYASYTGSNSEAGVSKASSVLLWNPALQQFVNLPDRCVECRAVWDWYLVGKLNTEPRLRPTAPASDRAG